MTTQLKDKNLFRASIYLDPDLNAALDAFKEASGIQGDSPAIGLLIRKALFGEEATAAQETPPPSMERFFESMTQVMQDMRRDLDDLRGKSKA